MGQMGFHGVGAFSLTTYKIKGLRHLRVYVFFVWVKDL